MIRKTVYWSIAIAFCVSLLAAGPLSSPPAWAQGGTVSQTPAAKINPALPGSNTGTLLKATDGAVRIDRSHYALAPGALIEDFYGNPVPLLEYVGNAVEIPVRYWLGTGETRNQIVQMILTFSE
jgi:hypothetical protein